MFLKFQQINKKKNRLPKTENGQVTSTKDEES